MSTFNVLHPRDGGGKFRHKTHSAPATGLIATAPQQAAKLFAVTALDTPDPSGGFDTSIDAPTGKRYLARGRMHRLDGPAYIGKDGTEEWYVDGELHRDDGPAVMSEGNEEWYDHGQLIRQIAA